jgi:threonine/homoserine/homoserine lactone efflux protein
MTFEMLVALVGFAFVMSISPGPGNFILLASGVNFGFRRSVPIVLGISAGFLSMVLAVGLGLGPFLHENQSVYAVLKLLCAAYVFWLALKIARSSPMTNASAEKPERPISFLQASLFQLVNPKAWAVALIVTVSYTTPADYLPSLLAMIVVFAVVNLPAISMWALFGVGLRQLLNDPAKVRVFNIAMALLLVGSMIPVLLDVPLWS